MKLVSGRLPSSVTTSVSSMRTPPTPGRYTPGSTVTTTPGARIAVPSWLTVGASWMSRPDAVAGAVLERVGPAGLGDHLAADVVDLLGPDPGPHGGHPFGLGVAHHLEDPGQLAVGLAARRRTSGSCPSGSRRRSRRSRPPPAPRRRCGRSVGWWWGLAEFGPAATIVSKAAPSAPPRRMAVSRARANSSSVTGSRGRGGEERQHLGQRGVGDGRRPGHPGQLALVLHLAQRLDHPGGRHHLGPPRSSSSVQRRLRRPAHVVGLETDPRAPRRRAGRGPRPAGPAAPPISISTGPVDPGQPPPARPTGSGSGRRW